MAPHALSTLGLCLLLFLQQPSEAPFGVPFQAEEIEEFLETAKVVGMKGIPVGVSLPRKATLTDGARTASAVWKTIDVYEPFKRFDNGEFEMGFRDTYKNEIAAYELDKLLGLGMVPPTVPRRIRRERGSLQLWVEGTITELERMKRNLKPKDLEDWNQQMYKVRLFHQLTYNTDYNNIQNLLVDAEFRLFIIDSSRAFRRNDELRSEKDLHRFSRSLLDRLGELSQEVLKERLGKWLTKIQIEALLKRRDLILARAEALVTEKGEEAVLYP